MKRILKNKISACLIAIAVALLAAGLALPSIIVSQKAYAYKTAELPTDDKVINLDNATSTRFTEDGLNQLAVAAGYTDLSDMMDSATTAGTSLTDSFTDKVVRLGKDTTAGGDTLKWVPVYLSRDNSGNATLTLWLATDVYSSTWSDGTYSENGTQDFNGSTICSNTYDGSFIRHKLNGKTGWTTNWGKGSAQSSANDNIRTLVSNFYGSGVFAGCVTIPANVSWQANANYVRNDPEWDASGTVGTKANYPCDWLNDNVWLPSIYEVCDSTVAANNVATSFTANGGLWQVNKGKICSVNNGYSWLRSGNSSGFHGAFRLTGAGTGRQSAPIVNVSHGVRPALHINLEAALNNVHTHNWDENADTDADGWKVTKPATCMTKGEEQRICAAPNCDLPDSKETREIAIAPTAHGWGDWVVTKEATCTAPGEETKTCSYNSEHKETRPITVAGHDYDDEFTVDTEATCTTAGSKSRHCKNCTDKIEVTPIPILGHDWGDWQTVTEAGCTSQGLKRRTCNRSCGVAPEEQPITATGHSYTDEVTDPDCENDGYTTHTCSKCGNSYEDSTVPATGHSYGEPVWQWNGYVSATATFTCEICNNEEVKNASISKVTANASCTVAGDTTYTAKVNLNGTEYTNEKISRGEKLPHTPKLVEESQAATCTEMGSGLYECEVCHEQYNDAIEALGHDFADEFTEDLAATCTADGSKSKHCSRCTEKTEVTAIPATGHTAGDAATCTTAQACTECGTEIQAALGHNYEAAEGGVAPTCTEEGSGKLVCSRCNEEKEGDSIPALGHTEVTDEAVAPTCTDTGLTAGTHCSVCGEVLTAQEEVPALGHSYEWVITKEATTEEAGLMENLCTVCGDKDGEQEIAKLVDPNGEIDLPVDINVEFKVTQSSTDNDYSDIEKGLKRGYWAQLWYRNDDGTLGDEFTDQINCFLTLKIPTDIIEAIRGGEEINRDKIAAGLKVYYIDGDGTPVEVNNFTIAMRDDDSWQIKFNYNEKFRAEVVFAADLSEQPTPEPEQAGIPWWVWLIVGLVVVAIVGVVIVIIVVAKKKGDGGNGGDTEELKAQLAEQGEKIDELLGRDDGGFNTPVELDENGNVIFK